MKNAYFYKLKDQCINKNYLEEKSYVEVTYIPLLLVISKSIETIDVVSVTEVEEIRVLVSE